MIKPLVKNVLVAVNGSEASIHALMYGIILAKQQHINLKAVFVVDTATLKQLTLTKFFVADESENYEENLITDGKRCLQYAADLAKQKGVRIETEVRKGAVWAEVIKSADEYKSDLILIGGKEYRSYDSLRHNMVSVARSEIIASAHCSVLVVREPELENLFKHL
ncbi:MAG: universal stress protein [Treponema sp.]|nr:universal stress protein [Spirochaetia bacterium]MDD6295100.1 universal stress protein [Treponema sp.]MDY5683767.1 universal stress protein [Treponema sp.]